MGSRERKLQTPAKATGPATEMRIVIGPVFLSSFVNNLFVHFYRHNNQTYMFPFLLLFFYNVT